MRWHRNDTRSYSSEIYTFQDQGQGPFNRPLVDIEVAVDVRDGHQANLIRCAKWRVNCQS